MKPSVALQLYTVRDATEKDLKGTLAQIKAMGYENVELAGMYGLKAPELKSLLDTAGLKAISAHVPLEALAKDPAATVADYKLLGCQIVSIPWADNKDLAGGVNFADTKVLLNKVGELCKASGMVLTYHNHAHEFEKLPCGTFVLDALMEQTCPDVLQLQPDLGWVMVAGQDPVQYMTKYKGRCPIIHIKDIKLGEKREDQPVGQGSLDVPAIVKAAKENGVSIIVAELDEAVGMTSLEAAKQSLDFLKSQGL